MASMETASTGPASSGPANTDTMNTANAEPRAADITNADMHTANMDVADMGTANIGTANTGTAGTAAAENPRQNVGAAVPPAPSSPANTEVPAAGIDEAFLADRNMFWSRFTTFTTGAVIAVAVLLIGMAIFLR